MSNNDFNLNPERINESHIAVPFCSTPFSATFDETDPACRAKELLTLSNAMPNGMNFELTRELALECANEILDHWLPNGEQRGVQYVALNPTRHDSNLGSFTINTETGVWSDFAIDDKGGDLISLVAYLEHGIKQIDAAVKILQFLAKATIRKPMALAVAEKAKSKVLPKAEYTVVMPVPKEQLSRRPVFFGPERGKPTATWEYRNATGQVLFFVNRFDTQSGKTFRPQTCCKDSLGWTEWKTMAPPVPRPAYGLDRLAANVDAPVLFVEGEKAADAAQRLFPTFVAVTTMNGSKSPEKSDLTPFAGRQVYIAPDNDEAGTAYKDKLIALLGAVGADVVAVMRLSALVKNGTPLEKGYDLADAESAGWTPAELAALGDRLWEPIIVTEPEATCGPATAVAEANVVSPQVSFQVQHAQRFALTNHDGHVAVYNDQIYAYRHGYWAVLNPDAEVKLPILSALGEKATSANVKSIFEVVKTLYAVTPDHFERKSVFICLRNGTLDPISGQLFEHAPHYRLTNQVQIEYDPQAQCPLWFQTLDEIFPDDDRLDKKRLLQEYIGYCLIPDTRMHKFLWLVGAGGNGKSLILDIITELIGEANISNAQLERLQEKFVRAELQGKLVNLSSEMSAQSTVADGYLKQITAGDMIEAERKFARPFSFRPYARLIGATNTMPRLLDNTDAFFRRMLVLPFNRQFTEQEQDKQRKSKLMDELPGILNWAIAGLQALFERGHFVIPPSSRAEIDRYRVASDPVRQFAEDRLTVCADKALHVRSSCVYGDYKAWSLDNGYKVLASNQFAERLANVGIRKARRNDGRYWEVKFKDTSVIDLSSEPQAAMATKYSM